MSKIHESLTRLFRKNLYEVATDLNYSDSNLLILSGSFRELKDKFPSVWNALNTCRHNRDKRSIEEYAQDLVSSWVYEDTLRNQLVKNFDIILSGSDKSRNILPNSKVSTNADYIINWGGSKFYLELVNSYGDYWKRTKKLDLRDNKFEQLKSKQALLVCIDIYYKDFFIIDLSIHFDLFKYIKKHKPWGNKPAYQLRLDHIQPTELTIKKLTDALHQILPRPTHRNE